MTRTALRYPATLSAPFLCLASSYVLGETAPDIEGPRRAVLIGDVIFASAIKMMSDVSADDGRAAAHAASP